MRPAYWLVHVQLQCDENFCLCCNGQVVEMSTPEIIQQQVEEQSNASPENAVMANTVMHLFANLSRCIADDYNQKFNSVRMSVDRKLRRMMLEKKQALGLKEEHIQEPHQY